MKSTLDIEKIILEELSSADIATTLVYIFGSYARDELRPDSDIDIAFLSLITYEAMDIFLLAQKISTKLHREVDLVQLKLSSTVFQKEVVAGGKLIFKKDDLSQGMFEMLTYKKYMRLNEERAGILENYASQISNR